jgi:hypothetical protein
MHENKNTFTSTKHSNNYKHNKQIKQKHTNIWAQTKHNITRTYKHTNQKKCQTHKQNKNKQRKKTNKKKQEPYLIASNKSLNP